MYGAKSTLTVFIILGLGQIALGEESLIPSSVSAYLSTDSGQTKTTSLFADLSVSKQRRLLLGYSRTKTTDDTAFNPSGITLGLGTDPLAKLSYEALLNTWGVANQITANSITGAFKYLSDNWDLRVSPRLRRIVGHLPGRDIVVLNFGLYANYSLYFSKNWSWTVYADLDAYDNRMESLQANFDRITTVSPNFSRLIQTLNQFSLANELTYNAVKWWIGYELLFAKTAITATRYSINTIRFGYTFSPLFTLEVSGGSSRDIDSGTSPNNFVGIAGTFSF